MQLTKTNTHINLIVIFAKKMLVFFHFFEQILEQFPLNQGYLSFDDERAIQNNDLSIGESLNSEGKF